jgi:hypothetical protein
MFAALKNMCNNVDIHRAWEDITENIKISGKQMKGSMLNCNGCRTQDHCVWNCDPREFKIQFSPALSSGITYDTHTKHAV